ncbi:alpha/beta-hydrolase [Microthyrium microscopicum]|uniref:Alpha/beta-hydrolase n=1 Tax=Microthyrium microscopicum TaxID=703497 RepID=A0A6A6UAV5_9PEZI|nr:alpha/beta-hydrolase [Microthyrium microscopicum]
MYSSRTAQIFVLASYAITSVLGAPGVDFQFEKRQGQLPILKLPYQSYQATNYTPATDVYTFRNIRYGASTAGSGRWALPKAPENNSTLSDGSYGPSCPQTVIPAPSIPGLPPGTLPPGAPPGGAFVPGPFSEDCLFLNLFVPGKALKNPSSKLPIIVSIHGGAYVIGNKDAADGTGIGNAILVAGNYRLGPFGFLAGTVVEAQGKPNAGFYDQIAVFEWVQKYSSLFGGDKTDVSAWGESAGGGSVFHHMIFEGGKRDPLFNKAIVQSPAISPQWDSRGQFTEDYKTIEQDVGCAGQGLACLRNVPTDNITLAGNAVQASAPGGVFRLGPAPDGKLIRQLAQLEYASGNYWKGIKSVISSHVANEAEIFFDQTVTTDAGFDDWLRRAYPKVAIDQNGWAKKIAQVYPPVNASGSPYKTESDRMRIFLQDTTFTCNTRFLSVAYIGQSWNIQYSTGDGLHGSDVFPTYYNGIPPNPMSQAYQSYLVSHATTGDPNTNRIKNATIEWPKVQLPELAFPVLEARNTSFGLIADTKNPLSRCSFVLGFFQGASAQMGYAV